MSPVVPIAWYLVLAAFLFSTGVGAFLIKRNIITIFMSIELMLNAVNLTFVAFAHMWNRVRARSSSSSSWSSPRQRPPSASPSSSPSSAPARPSTSTKST